MATVTKQNLGFLGADYQYKLVGAFMQDHKYFKDIYCIIEPNAFTETYLRGIVGIMKDYYEEYESVPSFDMVSIKIGEKLIHNDEDKMYYDETIEKLKSITCEGREEIESLGMKFFRQQEVILRANEMLKVAASGGSIEELEQCQNNIAEAISVKRRSLDISSPFESIDDDLSEENVVSIPTGISDLDEVLGGGLQLGKIGIIIGPSGFGKTSMTTCMAGNAAIHLCKANNFQGFKVLQIVFEDTKRDIHRKYISKVSQVETADLNKNEEITESVRAILKNSKDKKLINNNIEILRLESGEYSVSDIKKIIKQRINEGFKPDLVIIDYFECLAPEPGTARLDITERESKTMRKLENMAPELDIAIWVPTQGNRESFSTELLGMANMGGSIKKGQISHVVLSIAKTTEQKKENLATISLIKQRGGRDTISLENVYFNNGTCTIDCSKTTRFEDDLEYNDFVTEKEKEIQMEMLQKAQTEYKLHKS